jgi:hypothetical protein
VITGCSGSVAKQPNNHNQHLNDNMSQHDCDEEIAQAPWYDTASIYPDWAF